MRTLLFGALCLATPVMADEQFIPTLVEDDLYSSRQYLIDTAMPGGTMYRQGTALSIIRLHPEFVVKLARAIKQAREAGLERAGCFSAYRPPAFGVGGFKDKFMSAHAYGLACDMFGIGRPNSKEWHIWNDIAHKNGLIRPYHSRVEWNHYQLVPTKSFPNGHPLRITITAAGPLDLEGMWSAAPKPSYQTVMASFYWQPQKTANGEMFNPAGSTAAHKTLAFGTVVEVRNPLNGRVEVVRINDRGPFTPGRSLDLSRGTAERLGFVQLGVAPVEMRVLEYGAVPKRLAKKKKAKSKYAKKSKKTKLVEKKKKSKKTKLVSKKTKRNSRG